MLGIKTRLLIASLGLTFSLSVHAADSQDKANDWDYIEVDMLQVSGGGSSDYKGYGVELSKELGHSFFVDLGYYSYDMDRSYGKVGFNRSLVGAGYKTSVSENIDFFAQLSFVTLTPINDTTNFGSSSNYTDLGVGIQGRYQQFGYKVALINSQSSESNGSSNSGSTLDLFYHITESWSAGFNVESFEHEDEKSIFARYHF